VAISGSGNVAQYACEKVVQGMHSLPMTSYSGVKKRGLIYEPTTLQVLDLGGIPVTFSDSSGWIYDADGITRDKLAYIRVSFYFCPAVFPTLAAPPPWYLAPLHNARLPSRMLRLRRLRGEGG